MVNCSLVPPTKCLLWHLVITLRTVYISEMSASNGSLRIEEAPVADRHDRTVTRLTFVLMAITVMAASVAIAARSPAQAAVPIYQDPTQPVPARVADLLSRMTLDEKIGQMTQVDRGFLATQTDIATYNLGSLLSGGGSAPANNTASGWADMYDSFWSWQLY